MTSSFETPNPLDKLANVTTKYILTAFAYTEDACLTNVGPGQGKPGTQFSGGACGKPAIVIVNQFSDAYYTIDSYESEFSYYSTIAPSSTQMIGSLRIADRIGGQFPTFIREAAQKLGVSETHIAFNLKIYFSGTAHGPNGSRSTETIVTKPLIFNMTHMTQSYVNETQQFYTIYFLATYNTFGLMPTFSKMYQSTITNVEGNPSQEVPQPDVVIPTIIPRAQEDAAKSSARKARIDKSKTMETLGSIFDSFAEDMMQQKFEHKRQLQEWLSHVRDDHVKKISPPKQLKPGGIPVDYRFTLDGGLKSYKIDNRNMPFEQPEQSQEKYGVRSVPVADGEHLINFVEKIMKYSRQIAKDSAQIPRQGFKTNICIIRRCEGKYDLFLTVFKVTYPTNSPTGIDTGPGTAVDPIRLQFNAAGTRDSSIQNIDIKMATLINLDMMEKQTDDPDAEVVFGNREQATAERVREVDFFNSMYSGVRGNINIKNNGLESAEDAGTVDNSLMKNINSQPNLFSVKIRCNPNLLSDISRNPYIMIFGGDSSDDNPSYYPKPEKDPMYAKVRIILSAPADSLGIDPDSNDGVYYYEKHYHLYRIKTTLNADSFDQELVMLRTDDGT